MRVDFPEPETPVTQVKTPSGISTSMLLEIVFARAGDLDRRAGLPAGLRNGNSLFAREIIARQGLGERAR